MALDCAKINDNYKQIIKKINKMSDNKIGVLKIGKFYKTQKGKKVFIFFTPDGEIFSGVIEGEPFARLWHKDGKSFPWHNALKDNIIKEWGNK